MAVTQDEGKVGEIRGNACERGDDYAQAELTDPRRMVASTVRVNGGIHPLVPVYTAAPFPKPLIFDLLAELRRVELEAPVQMGQAVLENALGTGVDVLTSRDLPAVRISRCRTAVSRTGSRGPGRLCDDYRRAFDPTTGR
jgi:CxxC motif-containing protein